MDIQKGDRVMCGLPTHRCGRCRSCSMAEEYGQYCPNIDGHIGVTIDGAFAEYVVCDGNESSVLPDRVSFETAAPLACAGSTVYRGLVRAGLKVCNVSLTMWERDRANCEVRKVNG